MKRGMIPLGKAVGRLAEFWPNQCQKPAGNTHGTELLKFTLELRAMLNVLQITEG